MKLTKLLSAGFLPVVIAAAMLLPSSGCSGGGEAAMQDTTAWDYVAPPPLAANPEIRGENILLPSTVYHIPSYIERRPLAVLFADTNSIQLPAAQANGFQPVMTLCDAYAIDKPLVKIYSCDAYMLDDLVHSVPYLVPKAAQLLKEIGYAFQDTIRTRGGKAYRLKVTSCTRTRYSVGKLVRRNRAATLNSCHLYGTTFDISWVKFDCQDMSMPISLEDLKNMLAEVLQDFRDRGRCYVLFERKSGCFHVTVR